ncbi:MAG TPA: thiolase family protein [Candidatus Fraserbacteria bacterium]|nr:thiolase family protein [Candidatus Fraserbacteria bacterium]
MRLREPVIIEALRTPVGKNGGAFKDIRPDDLAIVVLQALLERSGIEPGLIEDVIIGCVTQKGEQGGNLARLITLAAGLPVSVAATSVNRLCGSGQQAVTFAAQEIATGLAEVVLAGGVESMSRELMASDLGPLNPKLTERYEIVVQGESAERIAERWEISRRELDQFSLESHRKAAQAADEGRFAAELVPVPVAGELIRQDETIRRNTSLEKMATLAPAFRPAGVITAGNSSQISDGAALLLLTSREKAQELGLKPKAHFLSWAVIGVDPTIMLTGPIPATQLALKRAGLQLGDLDIFEVNEAFASVPLAWGRELDADWEKLNVNGGAIALGHPLGCSGARLMTTALHELERREAERALITMCIGFGQGIATIIERE